jgi:diadenosine tetraphosphate (Ap4A) HIT family hydrolase
MPLSPDDFHQRVMRAADAEGRLPLSRMTGWEVFPFEREGLTVVPLAPPEMPEPPRAGKAGVDCLACQRNRPRIWSDDHWRLSVFREPTGAPLLLLLQPHEHYDLPTLPDERASEFGRLLVHVARAVESLPDIARAHISRWGDGGEHLHVFVYARPAGFPQLRGTCFAIWDDLLPPADPDIRQADAAAVATALARSYGGSAEIPPAVTPKGGPAA